MAEEIKLKIEYFKDTSLHPSLDIKDKILIFGFRYWKKFQQEENIFLIVKDGKPEILQEDSFEFEGKKYRIETKEKKLIHIEERWSMEDLINFVKEYHEGRPKICLQAKEMIEKIVNTLKRYGELDKEIDFYLVASYILATYLFPIFPQFPFLHFKGVKGCGKSQWLALLEQLCFNGMKTKPSLAVFCDVSNSLRGTWLIDQAQYLKNPSNEELLNLLTDSYKRTGGRRRIMRANKSGGFTPFETETYCPKIFASVYPLHPDLRDRCLIIPLSKSNKNFPEPTAECEDLRQTRFQIYRFITQNYQIFNSYSTQLEVNYRVKPEITGRELNIWFPFEVILTHCFPEKIPETKKRFKQLYGFSEFEADELAKEIINSASKLFKENENQVWVFCKEFVDYLPEEVWGDENLSEIQKRIRVGKRIDRFNIATETKHTNKGELYLFEKERIERLKETYCKEEILEPPLKPNNNSSHSSL
jgi:hypothetical protein